MVENLSKIKRQILIDIYSLSIFWLILLLIKYFYPGFFMNTSVTTGLFIGSLLRVIFSRKFLIGLDFENGLAKITSMNQFLVKKEIQVPIEKMKEFKYHKAKWFGGSQYHFLDSPEFRFILLSKKIKEDVQTKMQEVEQNQKAFS